METYRSKVIIAFAIIIASLLIAGAAPAKEDPVNILLARAEEQIMKTDSRDAALELIEIYESVLDLDPENYEALWSLARYNILVGVAYTEDKKQKKKYYTTAVDYSVRAMRTNLKFKARMNKGEKPWNACDCLGQREIAALFYWYNGNGLISKECQSRIQQILNGYKLPRYKKVMARLIEIDPEWAGGHPYFAWAGYYSAIPEMMGRDLDKAEEFFDKAEAAGPNWIYIKYSKAVLLHTARGDKEAFVKDLEWVLAQDPKLADSPYPFNVYFQREAKEMLENVDDYFN